MSSLAFADEMARLQRRGLGDLTIELTAANRYRVLTWWRRLRLLDS
jgi:hypothetical protein